MKQLILAVILAWAAYGQVAEVSPYTQNLTMEMRGGQHAAALVKAQLFDFRSSDRWLPGQALSLTARSLGGDYDIGGAYRFYRVHDATGKGAVDVYKDLGMTLVAGSQGVKGALEAGYLFGDSYECYFWGKAALGNYWALSAGMQLGRLSLSGAYGSYFENRLAAEYAVGRARRWTVEAGVSSVLGPYGGLRYTLR